MDFLWGCSEMVTGDGEAQRDKTPLKRLHADDHMNGNTPVTSSVSLLPLPASHCCFPPSVPFPSFPSSRQSLYMTADSHHNIVISDDEVLL